MSEEVHRKRLSYTASLVTQGKHRFYSLTIPSDVLARTTFVITRDEDPRAGFQRLLSEDRAREIADYIDTGLGTIPTSVILSAQEDAHMEYIRRTRTLSFEDTPRAFMILDGQHRVYGFSLAKSQLRVPVVIYNELSRTDESRLFIDINVKQRPVPNELLLDIKKLAEYQSDVEERLSDIFDLFESDPQSPLSGLMSAASRSKNKISRVTFNSAVKPHLALFASLETRQVYEILASYLIAFLVGAKDRSLDIPIVNPTVFKGVMAVFPAVAEKVKDRHGSAYTTDNFSTVIEEMMRRVKATALSNVKAGPTAYAKVFIDALKSNFTI